MHSLFLRAFVAILSVVLATSCSGTDDTNPENAHIQLLDDIPQHVQKVENITIYPGDSEPRYSIELIPEQGFGADGEPWMTHISGAVVNDNDHLIIWDINTEGSSFPPPNRLNVYNPDGSFHTQIGGNGRGPGEFIFLMAMNTGNGKVYALDHTSQRLNVYNAEDYSFERSTLVDQWSVHNHEEVKDLGFGRLDIRNDGYHLAAFFERVPVSGRSPVFKFMLMDTDGNVLDHEPLLFPSGFTIRPQTTPPSPSMTLLFMGHTISALSPDDALYSAWTRDFLIKKHDANGVYESAIYYPVTGSPFDLRDHTESSRYNIRDIRNAFDNSEEELPETNAVLADIMVDDENRIWAAVPMDPQRERYEWWILDESGELLAKLQRPREKTIFDIKDGYLYAKEIDEETDAEYVVKYRIEFGEAQ
jgi:hypothetical protein